MKSFTPTQFRASSSDVFNAVQSDGEVKIESKNRPSMVIMMKSQFDALQELVAAMEKAVKKDSEGDLHLQDEFFK